MVNEERAEDIMSVVFGLNDKHMINDILNSFRKATRDWNTPLVSIDISLFDSYSLTRTR